MLSDSFVVMPVCLCTNPCGVTVVSTEELAEAESWKLSADERQLLPSTYRFVTMTITKSYLQESHT